MSRGAPYVLSEEEYMPFGPLQPVPKDEQGRYAIRRPGGEWNPPESSVEVVDRGVGSTTFTVRYKVIGRSLGEQLAEWAELDAQSDIT